MNNITTLSPSISDLLDEFFAAYKPRAGAPLRARIGAVRAHLEEHLESEGDRVLTSTQQQILAAERMVDPDRAFVRLMHADDLYYCLVHYLDPVHALGGALQRETQLDIVAALADVLWRRRLVSPRNVSECAILDFDGGMKRARTAIRIARSSGAGDS